MNKKLYLAMAALLFLAGLAIFLYPHIQGAALEQESSQAAEEFRNALTTPAPTPPTQMETEVIVTPTPMPHADLYEAMREYNRQIYDDRQADFSGPWAYADPGLDLSPYGLDSGVIGVISIPKLALVMPLYLGATHDNLAAGAAVLGQTSLPIGGENTNCVIAGHRGWNGADYFRYVDTLAVGDEVILTNLWETLNYRVVESRIIYPDETEAVHIQEGRDQVTLLTCHPYASGGKQRLLVFCERVT